MFLIIQQARPGLVTWLHGLKGTRLEAVKSLRAKPLNWLDIASIRPSQVPGVGKETLYLLKEAANTVAILSQ